MHLILPSVGSRRSERDFEHVLGFGCFYVCRHWLGSGIAGENSEKRDVKKQREKRGVREKERWKEGERAHSQSQSVDLHCGWGFGARWTIKRQAAIYHVKPLPRYPHSCSLFQTQLAQRQCDLFGKPCAGGDRECMHFSGYPFHIPVTHTHIGELYFFIFALAGYSFVCTWAPRQNS